MKRAHSLLFVLVSATSLAACDHEQHILLRTVDTEGRPVDGIELEAFCPATSWFTAERTRLLGTTEKGMLSIEEINTTPMRCVIRLRSRTGTSVMVRDICSKPHPLWDSCLEFQAELTVEPQTELDAK